MFFNYLLSYNQLLLPFLETTSEYFYVGTLSPLWCCKHAMNKLDKCVYCECDDCYKKKGTPPRAKRSNTQNQCDKQDCNHEILEPETRSEYFSNLYLQSCIKKKLPHPTHCSKCYKMLTGCRQMAMC